jgi:hypothetical protein
MSEPAGPQERGVVRTAVLLLLTITIPVLGLLVGGIEMGSGNYRFGALLILVAVVCQPVLWYFLRSLAPM